MLGKSLFRLLRFRPIRLHVEFGLHRGVLQDAGHNVIILDRESLLFRNAMDWNRVNEGTSDILKELEASAEA